MRPALAVSEMAGRRLLASIADGLVLLAAEQLVNLLPLPHWSLWDLVSNASTRTALCSRGSLLYFAGALSRSWPPTNWSAIMIALSAIYFIAYVATLGASPGKLLFGLRVRTTDGGTPTIWQATCRYAGYWLSSWVWGLGYIPILWGGRPLHDALAGTKVVHLGDSGDVYSGRGDTDSGPEIERSDAQT